VDPTALEVAFRVSAAQYARLLDAAGALGHAPVTARLGVAGVDLVAKGRIDRESAEVGAGLTGRLLFATLDDARGFRPGDFVTVAVEEPPLADVARLPAAALDAAGHVLVLGEGDRLQDAPVELVRRQGDDVLVRAPGLEGRQVVAAHAPVLGAGIKVRPVTAGAADAASAPAAATSAGGETIALDDARRARLIAFVKTNAAMPEEARARILEELKAPDVPAETVSRLEARMGGG